ncbi:DNA-binding transcriptional regulator YhcF (GntR family) [Lewinella marina]|uniref:Transcriptional regulator n=1 Tax=Neolewinella marina TaxID=438751 RepID=A0A2G0CCU5_9BACT|nr:GntR family transcriptional regulator [Neolewinella marina]NJB87571.1 DNA-binding transcriptional regulator YhcF (GntR family) [Neolewinella marina]PHK97737.1 transcriptional regulator [Neolewinella marina]
MAVTDHISITEESRIPKYQQIVNAIIDNISSGKLEIDDKIPSINVLSETFDLSRDTVEKAYNILKERNIITSVKGKGFYITRTKLLSKVNVLFLVNKLSTYKMRIYNAFVEQVGGIAHTDLYIYHCDESLFLNLLSRNLNAYDYFVIMPHFKTPALRHVSFTEEVVQAMEQIPKNKLIVMDNNHFQLAGDYAEVYQDFENDIYQALKSGLEKIRRYKRLILVYPEASVYPYPRRILHGFRKFCVESQLPFEIIQEIYEDTILRRGDLFITIEESDLVNLVKQIRDKELRLGDDIGIISYNETPLKDLLGITVISTDFATMGRTAADLILNKKIKRIKNPFRLIERESV